MANFVVTTGSDRGADATSAGTLAADQADGDGLSLQEAVALANAYAGGDSITFEGVTTAFVRSGALLLNSDISIDGDLDDNGTPDVRLAGLGVPGIGGGPLDRIFFVKNGTSTLDGLIIAGGLLTENGDTGAGIFIDEPANLTLTNSIVTNNSTGGIGGLGGGIHNTGELTIVSSQIVGNSTNGLAAGGGGLANQGTATLISTVIEENVLRNDFASGGGILNSGTPSFTNGALIRNETLGDYTGGGGISNNGQASLRNITVFENSASGSNNFGGGLFNGESGTLNLLHNTIVRNTIDDPDSLGAAIFSSSPGASTTLLSSIVAENRNDAGPDGQNGISGTVPRNATPITDALAFESVTELTEVPFGGVPTLTLSAESVAIDVAPIPADLPTDATGAPRSVDRPFLGPRGRITDAGAAELQPTDTLSLVVTTAQDIVTGFDGQTSLREAIGHINDGTLTGTITFSSDLAFSSVVLNEGALSITGDVRIDGDANGDGLADITIDGFYRHEVFEITGGTSVLENLTIQHGLATNGGGLHISGAGTDVTLDGVELNGNIANDLGGGIFQAAGTSLTLINSGVLSNAAGIGGGGVYTQGDLTVVGTTFQSNSVSGGSGGAGAFVRGTSSFTNTTFTSNSASGPFSLGGGLFNSGDLTLTNSTLSGNSADYAAGLYQSTTATLTNSIVLGNNAGTGGEIEGFGTTTLAQGNIIGTNVYSGATSVGNTTAAQVFQYVGANGEGQADFNGGAFQTIALRADAANPAIDVGVAPVGVATDAAGNTRDVDIGIIDNGGTVDAGAVEVQAVQEAASLVVTIATDTEDSFDGETSLREAIGHLNDGTLSGTITFASGVGDTFETGGTVTLGGTELTLTSDVAIIGDVDGDGSGDVSVDGGGASRVFNASSGTSVLQALTITGGNASSGAGVNVGSGASLRLEHASIEGNAATSSGGGLNNRGNLTLLDSVVTDNSAGSIGGGVYSGTLSTTTLTNTTLEGNSAAFGGGLHGQSATIELVNVTATGNSAGSQGGAVFANAGNLGLTNSVVIGNTQATGSQVSLTNTFLDVDNTLLVGNAADIFAAVDPETGGGQLADNGGPLETVALLLDAANPAVDAGNVTLLAESIIGFDLNGDGDLLDTITTDANGDARVVGAQVDMGAVELQAILGSVGGDTLTGSANSDTIVTGSGVDVIIAGDGNDSVDGGADEDAVSGGGGNDTIEGGSGDDLLVGGTGGDLLYGGNADDEILPGADADTVFGGAGEDTVSYVNSGAPVTVDLSDGTNNAGDAAGDEINEVENIIGSSTASNTLTGDTAANTLDGGAANDSLSGGGGNDRLEGNGGADTLDGGPGDDIIVVDSADDVTDQAAGEGYDRVLSSASVTLGDNVEAGNLLGTDDLSIIAASTGSWINGNAGNNTLTGQDGADRLDGNAGDDLIDGAGGNDLLEGGSGADTFVLSDGIDIILDFEDGVDQVDLTDFGLLFSDLSATQSGANVALGHSSGTLIINNINLADLSAADFIEPVASAPPVVTGTEGVDSLFQPAGPIEIQGLGGNDLLGAFSGAATLVGGDGNDQYYVYDANTVITELAGEGTDLARSQVDLVLAENVENGAVLGAGDVDLTGNALGNFLTGSAGSNALSSGAGNDRLIALAGADTLEGGTGNDILQGGASDGAVDRFAFNTGDGNDVIIDFEINTDVIDLTATGLQFADLTITGATNALIDTGTDLITVNGVTAAQLDSDQFEFAPLA